MKFVAPLSLLLSGCATVVEPPVPLAEVLNDPIPYDDTAVRICGFLVDSIEQCSLWERTPPPKRDPPMPFASPGMSWLAIPGEACAPDNPNPMSGDPPVLMWVVVSGIFQTGESYGHLNEYDSQILVETIEPSSFMCGRRSGT